MIDQLFNDVVELGTSEHVQQGQKHIVPVLVKSQVDNFLFDCVEEDLLLFLSVDDLHEPLHGVGSHLMT